MRKSTTVGKHAENGRQIFAARRRKGMTQTELGAAAGVTYRQIIRLENGEHLPSGPVRDKIADVLDLDRLSIQSGDDEQEVALPGDTFRGGSESARGGSNGGGAESSETGVPPTDSGPVKEAA